MSSCVSSSLSYFLKSKVYLVIKSFCSPWFSLTFCKIASFYNLLSLSISSLPITKLNSSSQDILFSSSTTIILFNKFNINSEILWVPKLNQSKKNNLTKLIPHIWFPDRVILFCCCLVNTHIENLLEFFIFQADVQK